MNKNIGLRLSSVRLKTFGVMISESFSLAKIEWKAGLKERNSMEEILRRHLSGGKGMPPGLYNHRPDDV